MIAILRMQHTYQLLFSLRLLSLGLLLAVALISQLLPANFFQQLINWPLLSLAIIAAALLSVMSLILRPRLQEHVLLFCALLLDSLIWFMAISATGGAINPAVSYALVLLCVAAISLAPIYSFILFVCMGLAYAALLELSPHHHHAMMMSWHLWGMWLLFLLNAGIILWVTRFLLRRIQQQDLALQEFREQQVRDEKLIALGTLSASVAHELATPLSTIAVLVEGQKDDHNQMIEEQVQRCKQVLQTLRQQPRPNVIDSEVLLQTLRNEMQLLQPAATIHWHLQAMFDINYSSLLEHALLALLNNAVEAAATAVDCQIDCSDQHCQIDIAHDGEPIDEQLLSRLGKETVSSDKGFGMGHYLANASIEKLGGSLLLLNAPQPPSEHRVLMRVRVPIVAATDVKSEQTCAQYD